MKLTDEQKNAVRCDEDLMLTACPGSGKTRVIISKLVRVLEEVRDTSRGIACITYTNAAVNEIESRIQTYLQPDDNRYYDICTIHSFCLNNIFRPFCHLIDGYKQGFKVLTPDNEAFEKHVTAICAKYGRFNLRYRDFEEFTQLRVSLQGEPVGNAIDRGGITVQMAKDYWMRIQRAGFIDFANIIYHSLSLLRERPEILNYVSSKFAWILVDEFQDTTDLQVEILALIAARGKTRFLFVGDPYQSIYRFAGARPDLAEEFPRRIRARTDMGLTGNFRSSPPIIAQAEKLYPRTPAMEALGTARRFTEEPEWRHGNRVIDVITDYFLPALDGLSIPVGNAAILAPTWFTLFPLSRQLRDYGVRVVGPGARPYRRSRHFAPLAEAACGYLMEPEPESIVGIERTLFNTLLDTTGRANFDISSYRGRTVVFRLLGISRRLRDAHPGGVRWLEAAAKAFSDVLVEEGYFSSGEQALFAMSVEEMKADMRNNQIDLDNLSIDDLGIYASPSAALKLSTLHNAKGREYEAVAMIDVHEGRIPSYYAKTREDLDEQKRLFYVGVTRAKRYLLYVTDNSGQDGASRFLRPDTGVGVRLV
jgi:DNA helicase-2/ATP-dependent DNA helicase PcrA